MIVRLYVDAKIFYNDTYELLTGNEALNMVFLGDLSARLSEGSRADETDWVMAAVHDEGCVLAALMLPGEPLQIYAKDSGCAKGFEALADVFCGAGARLPGVNAEYNMAEAFAKAYSDAADVTYSVAKKGRVYVLDQLSQELCTKGQIRLADKRDLAFLPYWWSGFFGDVDVPESLEAYERLVHAKNLYILEDEGVPVSMGRIDQQLEQVCGLGLIYTPPYFRNKGYATRITADLSKICLDRGYQPALVTDLANPISNSIYQKLGYKPSYDTLEIVFAGC